MPYLLNTPDDQREMLETIGVDSIDRLFDMVPGELRLPRPLDLPPALGEIELTAAVGALARKNLPAGEVSSFLGGGSYDHFIPALVDFVAARSEFYTAYTPYQAEASQGNLQAMFEYQTLITQLTGLDVSNASLYDGGSAATEAVLMSIDATGRDGRVIVPESVHPEYRQILATYLANTGTELLVLPTPGGAIDPAALKAALNAQTACVVVQHPNFFGCLESPRSLADLVHAAGAMLVEVFDPISLGLLARPGELGADIAVAEGQCLGNPMAFGGPYVGILACREQFVRRMPGRLVGQTVDRRGQRCWALTLQTREQHIRREKATSNICTNQSLLALRSAVYLAALGGTGLRGVAELCLQKARYAASRLTATGKAELAFASPTFKEFVVRLRGVTVERFIEAALGEQIFAGVALGRWYPPLADCLLVAVTEKRTKAEIDRLAAVLSLSAVG